MTRLIASISSSTLSEQIARARAALAEGADLVELRLDYLADWPTDIAAACSALPRGRWIATIRSIDEGGKSTLSPAARLEQLRAMLAAGAGWIDFEDAALRSMASGGTAAEVIGCDPRRVILSAHNFDGPFADPTDLVGRMTAALPGCIVKIAWAAADINDNFTALELSLGAPGSRMVICMGEKGMASRVLAAKGGAFGTYGSPSEDAATAPGQVTIDAMRNLYRSRCIIEQTQVYGVIGSPVSHSLSPLVFNRQFADHGLDAVYLPLRIDDEDELVRFLDNTRRCAWLNARGFSVTLPHKSAALAWGGEGADSLAKRIGAANTLLLSDRPAAYNTDCPGAMQALAEGAGLDRARFSGLTVAVLGAGGVSRAIVAGLCDAGANVTIYNRTLDRARKLANEFGARAEAWEDRGQLQDQLIVNCTSLGMSPKVVESPLPSSALGHQPIVFDTIYTPAETRLTRDAAKAGCNTVGGLGMFIHQAAAQYRLWTGRTMDIATVTRTVTLALAERERRSRP